MPIVVKKGAKIPGKYSLKLNTGQNDELFKTTAALKYSEIFNNSRPKLLNGHVVRTVVNEEINENDHAKYQVEVQLNVGDGYAVLGRAFVLKSLNTVDSYVQEVIEQKVLLALRKSMVDGCCYEVTNDE